MGVKGRAYMPICPKGQPCAGSVGGWAFCGSMWLTLCARVPVPVPAVPRPSSIKRYEVWPEQRKRNHGRRRCFLGEWGVGGSGSGSRVYVVGEKQKAAGSERRAEM
jgi:hypothetical protein